MTRFQNPAVAEVFSGYPVVLRKKLMHLRQIILEVAAETNGVGELEECLKWGQPAYVTAQSRSGSTIRIDRYKRSATQYAMYFHCQTTLVQTFRSLFPDVFTFEGDRSFVFAVTDRVPDRELRICVSMALTYHLAKRVTVARSASKQRGGSNDHIDRS